MGARWYDPAGGVFTSRDSMSLNPQPSNNANRYLYGNGDPVDETDPTGTSAGARSSSSARGSRAPRAT
ncbi:RHS repeat-associated core domain-containing protein [Kutzneria kofuensis]|uniref:RHS repeat-associated core domain-containing protein n=1 Tax=Kutzneria kofuensis TaxID=103725 RepID=UPI0031F035B6